MISAAFDSVLNSRLFTNSSTLYRPQPSSLFYPFRARYFVFVGSRSASGGSASVTHRVQGDCALSARHQNTAPGPLGPQKFIGAMPCSIGWVTNLVVISQPLMDSRHRRIKSKTITGWLSMAAVNANPFAALLPHLNFYCIMHLPYGCWNMFF